MRTIFLIIPFLFFVEISFSQINCGGIATPDNWSFEGISDPYESYFQIDTLTNPGNCWQIGIPNKASFTSAFSSPNAIVTGLTNPYPPNDTSVFIFKQVDFGGYSTPQVAELSGYYEVNSDSLHDFGSIEISLNKGITWVNLLSDTLYSKYYDWNTPKPILTGNSDGWKNFWVNLGSLGIPFHVQPGDTILFKFTFISDSIPGTHEGLAFDNFQFCNGVEGIEEFQNSIIDIFPNPTYGQLYIKRNATPNKESIQVFNSVGQYILGDNNFKNDYLDIGKLKLSSGLYFLRYSNSREICIKPFIVKSE
jgi:hypothetical protein